jgi:hypothetical protein
MIACRRVEDVVDRQRGHEVRTVFLHQRKCLGGGERAVLHGVHARAHRMLDGAGRVDVCGHLESQGVRRLDRDAHFLVGHELLARIVTGRCDPARRHELDDVRAARLVLPYAQARLFR